MLFSLIAVVLIVGVLLYLFNLFFTTIDSRAKLAINALVMLFLFLYILNVLLKGRIFAGLP